MVLLNQLHYSSHIRTKIFHEFFINCSVANPVFLSLKLSYNILLFL
jgi:hypothetical protein